MEGVARSRARWRRVCLALAALWLLTVLWAIYGLIDQGVTLTHQGESRRHLTEDLGVLADLAPAVAGGVRRGEVLAALRRRHPTALITATDSTVGIGQLEFRFGPDGRLRAVEHPDLAESAAPRVP